MSDINDKALSKLFELARIKEETDEKKRKKLLHDLGEILKHFQELQEVDTASVEPMAGGVQHTDVYRNDDERYRNDVERASVREAIVEEFPEAQNEYVKVPGVFEK
jgi:aspartyl/glutamyl-tRNA(Asn/Gln) amidotransferase C subunit